MSEADGVLLESVGAVAVVTLSNPAKHNALTTRMVAELDEALREAQSDDRVRSVVLTGAGDRAFCAGGDLKSLLPSAMAARADIINPDPARRLLSTVFKPVVAAVRGACVGAGFEMLLGTDIRVGSPSASFGVPEVALGLIPGGGTHIRLPRQVPWAVAMELLLLGRSIDAARALEVGLINQICPDADVVGTAMGIAAELASKGPLAVQTAKEIAVRGQSLESGFALEHALNRRILGSSDAAEGVRAFLARDEPTFTGS